MSSRTGVSRRPEESAQRRSVATVEPAADSHAGLWLERYLPHFGVAGANQAHLEAVLPLAAGGAGYEYLFARWRAALESLPGTLFARATVRGRMAIGLGNESVLETAVTLHRTYGVPVIPGSALKGLAATAAHRRLADTLAWGRRTAEKPAGESHRILFGDTDESGAVVFHDALWWPEARSPLNLDVMTVHHPRYYQGDKEEGQQVPPADWDSPNPVAFATAHGSYLIALSGPGDWARAALAILTDALREDGIGGKTAAGYGRLDVVPLGVAATLEPPAGGAGDRSGGRSPGAAGLGTAADRESGTHGSALRLGPTDAKAITDEAVVAARIREIHHGNAADFVPRLLATTAAEKRCDVARRTVAQLGGARSVAKKASKAWASQLLAVAGHAGGGDAST